MYFQDLKRALIAEVRRRLQNGELTEWQLARLTGISQPHVSNLLKGVRVLSARQADRMLKSLKLSVLDLTEPAASDRAAAGPEQ